MPLKYAPTPIPGRSNLPAGSAIPKAGKKIPIYGKKTTSTVLGQMLQRFDPHLPYAASRSIVAVVEGAIRQKPSASCGLIIGAMHFLCTAEKVASSASLV